jgi:hypothetical protein
MCNDNEDRCQHPPADHNEHMQSRPQDCNLRKSDALTPLNALRRVERYIGACTGVHEDPDIEEAIARLWKFLVEDR